MYLISSKFQIIQLPLYEDYFLVSLMQNAYRVWGRSMYLSMRSITELKASLMLVPYRNTTVSASFLPGNKLRWKVMFFLTPCGGVFPFPFLPILWAGLQSQGLLSGLGLCAMSWGVKRPLSI